MKKFLVCILATIMIFNFASCGNNSENTEPEKQIENGSQEELIESVEPVKVTQTDKIRIDGIYVDDSYVNDGTPLKMVYIFYTLFAKEENIEINSFFTNMIINDTNEYDSDHDDVAASATKYAHKYYYSNNSATLYMGTEGGVVVTFKVPEADLAPGRSIKLSLFQFPEADEIIMSTDDIIYCSSPEELAEIADPSGYNYEMTLREDADEETAKIIENQLNGYYWTYYLNNIPYYFEFYDGNMFIMRIGSDQEFPGIYSVKKGYIFCEYANTDPVQIHVIPWTVNEGSFELDLSEGFDIFE